MHRIDGAGHVNNTFVAEDEQNNQPPTEVTAEWLNMLQEELANVVVDDGTPLDKNDNTQLLQAIIAIVGNAISGINQSTSSVAGIIELALASELAAGDATRAATGAGIIAGILGAGGASIADYIKIPYRDKTTGVLKYLIIQFGQAPTISSGAGSNVTVTLPLAFPNNFRSVYPVNNATNYQTALSGDPISLSQFKIYSNGVATTTPYYLAVGD